MAASDGSIVFKTDLDNSDLEKQLKNTEKSIDSLKKKIEGQEIERTVAEREIEQLEQQIVSAKDQVEALNHELSSLGEVGTGDAEQLRQRTDILRRMNEQYAQIEKYRNRQNTLDDTWQKANDKIVAYTQHLDKAQQRQRSLAAQYASSYSQAGASVSSAMAKARESMGAFANRVGSVIKQAFVFSVIYKAVGALRQGIGEALKQNQRFSASWEGLKAAINGFAIGIVNVVAPAISAVVNFATKMITNLARLVDMVFGTRIVAAIAQAQASAEDAWRKTDEYNQAVKDEEKRIKQLGDAQKKAAEDAAKAEDKQAKAAKDLGKEQKKANAQVLAFDELNKLAEESSEDVADAMDDYADAIGGGDGIDPSLYESLDPSQYLQPDWDALDVGKIDAKLAEVMLILGAALMAVGAILAFSGINIPLGLTLMVIGALMVYTAYQEAWDKLPQEVRDAITGAIAITGAVLLVLGSVLAFSGVNIPLGIGMMAAGAILLYTALALNWDAIPDNMRMVVTTISVIVGTSLLVVGAILTFTGANVPLGLGLMAVGAVALGGAAVLNWKYLKEHFGEVLPAIEAALGASLIVVGAVLAFSGANVPLGIGLLAAGAISLGKAITIDWNQMPADVKNTIATIESVVAPALLVLGAVLTFSGANIPLGIALLAGGAAMLVHLATLNWNQMPESVRNTVTTILGIVGGALIVIGIILCVTGVGIPLGIALIAAGAASLIAAAAINWNFIVDKVKEIWSRIVQFWRSNIAPVFTWQWWANVFKSMVNGLIQMINNGLNAFGGFINSLAGGVSDILDFFGVSGYSFSIGMPQIPYLAQGAVIPPNREFMAVLGDQRSGNNIEAPESLMRQVVREETGPLLADVVAAILGGNGGQGRDLVLMVGRKELARETLRGIQELGDTGELGGGIVFA